MHCKFSRQNPCWIGEELYIWLPHAHVGQSNFFMRSIVYNGLLTRWQEMYAECPYLVKCCVFEYGVFFDSANMGVGDDIEFPWRKFDVVTSPVVSHPNIRRVNFCFSDQPDELFSFQCVHNENVAKNKKKKAKIMINEISTKKNITKL